MAQPILFKLRGPLGSKGFRPLVAATKTQPTAAASGALWKPTDLGASCVALFDLTNAAKVTLNSGNISAVTNDAAGTVTLGQATAGFQPPFTAGQGGFFAQAGDEGLDIANLPTTGEIHYFIVGTPEGTGSWRTALWATSSFHALIIENGSNNFGQYVAGFTQFGSATAAPSVEALFYAEHLSGSNSVGATNGNTPAADGSVWPASLVGTILGNTQPSSGGGQGFGWIKEFVAVSGTLTTGDREKIEGYLAWKYGDQGLLPGGHTYKSAAPTTSGAGGTAVALAGDAAAVATAAGGLSDTDPLAAASAAQAGATGGLSDSIGLAGTATGTSAATGALTDTDPLAGTATGAASATGGLTGADPLAGGAAAQAAASGTLVDAKPLAGAATDTGAATGALSQTASSSLAGLATDTATATGTLSDSAPLAASASAQSTATGGLSKTDTLAGSASDVATTTGALSGADPLAGTATDTASATGALADAKPLTGSAGDTASATGSLSKAAGLAGTASDTATATGNLAHTDTLAGGATATATATGTLAGTATVADITFARPFASAFASPFASSFAA